MTYRKPGPYTRAVVLTLAYCYLAAALIGVSVWFAFLFHTG